MEFSKMSKEELMAALMESEKRVESLKKSKVEGRKDQVLNLIRLKGKISIKEMAREIGISERNISSQLSYLRNDKFKFGKNSKGEVYEEVE
jgi:predicted HTH transcriptional regulator